MRSRAFERMDLGTAFEKRRHPRVGCDIESSYKSLTGSETYETTVRDISEGGIRFRALDFIPLTERLLVHLRIPHHEPIETLVQPAWIREIPSVSQYELGAQMLSLSKSDRGLIREYIRNF
jgi:hypothetical protein